MRLRKSKCKRVEEALDSVPTRENFTLFLAAEQAEGTQCYSKDE